MDKLGLVIVVVVAFFLV